MLRSDSVCPPQSLCWNPHTWHDGIRKWDLARWPGHKWDQCPCKRGPWWSLAPPPISWHPALGLPASGTVGSGVVLPVSHQSVALCHRAWADWQAAGDLTRLSTWLCLWAPPHRDHKRRHSRPLPRVTHDEHIPWVTEESWSISVFPLFKPSTAPRCTQRF